MLEVVEGDVVVVAVDFKQEVLENVDLDVEGVDEVQVGVHHLQQHQHLGLLPLPEDTTAQHTYGVSLLPPTGLNL